MKVKQRGQPSNKQGQQGQQGQQGGVAKQEKLAGPAKLCLRVARLG
ncbi:MAG: hypothetical protein ACPIOQ_40645 [Promethearchaeia archaeon]